MLGIIVNICGLMFSHHSGGLCWGACGVVRVMMGLPLMAKGGWSAFNSVVLGDHELVTTVWERRG